MLGIFTAFFTFSEHQKSIFGNAKKSGGPEKIRRARIGEFRDKPFYKKTQNARFVHSLFRGGLDPPLCTQIAKNTIFFLKKGCGKSREIEDFARSCTQKNTSRGGECSVFFVFFYFPS